MGRYIPSMKYLCTNCVFFFRRHLHVGFAQCPVCKSAEHLLERGMTKQKGERDQLRKVKAV